MKILATDMDGTFLDHHGTYDKARLDSLLDAVRPRTMFLQLPLDGLF